MRSSPRTWLGLIFVSALGIASGSATTGPPSPVATQFRDVVVPRPYAPTASGSLTLGAAATADVTVGTLKVPSAVSLSFSRANCGEHIVRPILPHGYG
jgi:hypothetical protein